MNETHSEEQPADQQARCDNWMSFAGWLELLGVTSTTGWRWRKLRMVKPVCICGRLYISALEIARFWARAQQGEFKGRSMRWANKGRMRGTPMKLAKPASPETPSLPAELL